MSGKKRLFGTLLIVMALAMLVFRQVDVVGRINEWRHVPDVALNHSVQKASEEGNLSATGAEGEEERAQKALPEANPYAEDIARWQSANRDVIAWLDIPDLLSTPVVQGSDNDFYLTHDATGSANKNGAAFIDYEIPEQKLDHVVIYGHNMANAQVFSDLDAYCNRAYAEAHRFFFYATKDHLWQAEVICVCNMNLADPQEFFGFNTWLTWQNESHAFTYLDGLMPSMLFRLDTPLSPTDRMLTLSTCDNTQEDARILIVARLLPKDERQA